MARRRIESLYLAGPEVWFPNVGAHFALRQAMCEAVGFTMLPADTSEFRELEPGEVMAREIYAERVARMRRADHRLPIERLETAKAHRG